MRQTLEASLASGKHYAMQGEAATQRVLAAIAFAQVQEKGYEVRCLKEGSHTFWRKHQITVRRWSLMVEALEHERWAVGRAGQQRGVGMGRGREA